MTAAEFTILLEILGKIRCNSIFDFSTNIASISIYDWDRPNSTHLPPFFYFFLPKLHSGSDNLARFGALESLVNDMADDTWDNKAVNRISAIHFLDDDEDEDDEKVRVCVCVPSSPVALAAALNGMSCQFPPTVWICIHNFFFFQLSLVCSESADKDSGGNADEKKK